MKIAMLNWVINDAGGINTYGEMLLKGLQKLGYQVPLFHCTPGVRYGCDPNKKVRVSRHDILPGHFLSFNDKHIKQSIETLNQFDHLIFLHSSPHPTKENLNNPNIVNWIDFYVSTKATKTVIFHDANWAKTNKWFEEVAPFVDLLVSAQKKFRHSAEAYPATCEKYWDYFPMDLQFATQIRDSQPKKRFGMMVMQWIKWKKHAEFLPQLPQVNVPMKIFNLGMEFWKLRKEGMVQQYINKNFYHKEDWNPQSIHNYYGFYSYDALCNEYAKALFSIDTSQRGYMNYTHFEGLAFDCIPFIEKKSFADQDMMLPEDCSVIFDLPTAYQSINDFVADNQARKQKVLAGRKFVQNFACEAVAGRLVQKLKNLTVKN
jgi:hypothetical protein